MLRLPSITNASHASSKFGKLSGPLSQNGDAARAADVLDRTRVHRRTPRGYGRQYASGNSRLRDPTLPDAPASPVGAFADAGASLDPLNILPTPP